jgi:CDP-4-dehydro-6-deoxyglucose reductase, E3
MRGAKARVAATVVDVTSLSPRVRAVELRVRVPYTWSAGQHVGVSPEEEAEGARYYSFASVPSAHGTIELCVGDSDDAPAFPPGGQVWLSAPAGRAAVPEAASSLTLIGMGTGVAPLRAVLFEQARRVPAPSVTLLVGFRSESDVLYAEELERWQALGQLDYRPVLSQPGPGWRGRLGYVQDHVAELPRTERYCVCGKLTMVQDVQAALAANGVSPSQVFAEGY